jgi:hypothetical protein
LQQTALPKKPQTLVAQRIEGRKNLQHFCNKKPRNCPKIPPNTASKEGKRQTYPRIKGRHLNKLLLSEMAVFYL